MILTPTWIITRMTICAYDTSIYSTPGHCLHVYRQNSLKYPLFSWFFILIIGGRMSHVWVTKWAIMWAIFWAFAASSHESCMSHHVSDGMSDHFDRLPRHRMSHQVSDHMSHQLSIRQIFAWVMYESSCWRWNDRSLVCCRNEVTNWWHQLQLLICNRWSCIIFDQLQSIALRADYSAGIITRKWNL